MRDPPMADELPDFPGSDPFESNGQAISRSLSSSRTGRATIPLQFRERQQSAIEQDKRWRRDIEERKFEVQKTAAQAARDAALLKAAEVKFNLLSKMTDITAKREEMDHSIKAMEEFNGLDYKDGATPNRIADIYRRNPRALDNPRVAGFADKLIGMHETFLKDFRTDTEKDIEKGAAKSAEAAARIAGLAPSEMATKVGDVTTKFEAPKNTPDSAAKDDAAHLARLEGLRMKPSLARAIGGVDKKGVPKTREGRDAMDQINYLDEQIKTIKDRLSAKPAPTVATPDKTIVVPASATSVLPTAAPAATPTAATAPAATTAPAAKTVWKVSNGVKWEFDATTKQATGRYVKSS